MKIENEEILGIESALKASGYPKQVYTDREEDMNEMLSRGSRLGSCRTGAGHDCYLKGIVVQVDITAPQYWWLQFGRYHFADIVSSQSKMHKILNINIAKQCNEHVWPSTIDNLKKIISFYNSQGKGTHREKELFQSVIANTPMGLMLKARITTNYLQLKTMYKQRKHHKLEEWTIFCDWILELPYFEQLTGVADG